MTLENPFQGQLFADGFLCGSIAETEDWRAFDGGALDSLAADLRALFDGFPADRAPNEAQTETDLIRPVLERLGWTASLWQQRLSTRGRTHVPDGLLFAGDDAKERANRLPEEDRYRLGLAIVECKRWGRPLDRRSPGDGPEAAPATQMLRYLGRADVMTEGRLRWGILTDGAVWRLYWWGARSVAEQFFEVDLAALLDLPGRNEGLFALDEEARRHWLRVFATVFRPEAFQPGATDPLSFHLRAVEEGRLYEAEVAKDLSGLVFERAFPALARAIADAAPDAPLEEVREAALVLLYRLMFALYAEDRGLLPVRERGYEHYALRERVREDVGRRKDAGDLFTGASTYWFAIDDLCRAIDRGDAYIGLPAYNGGLFDAGRAPLLTQIRLPDALMADIIDALSFRPGPHGRRYINYRELGVQQLGSIYERLVERDLAREEGEIRLRLNPFVRKDWGSYYTPDDLVGLVIEETVGPLIEARRAAFREAAGRRAGPAELARLDPAERILELKICDPATGSGHFLVNLVDWLADRIIEAIAEAEAAAEGYNSPLAGRIEDIRRTILANAEAEGWSVDAARLDDRHIVRRMVLKRCIYGVDKNPMAIELAKVSLWLHTFTVGAPLSFLDHHLRCGDSLFGAWARTGMDRAADYDAPLLLHGPIQTAIGATEAMRAVEALTDAEIAEVRRSASAFAEVEEKTAPLDSFLSLIHAFDWLNIRSKNDRAALQAFFDGLFGDPLAVALGRMDSSNGRPEAWRFAELLAEARTLVREERFFNWQAAFPGVWTGLESAERRGGFDAVIGNPPWDRRMKLQRVEWFAARRPAIARAPRAADRRRMIDAMRAAGDPLAEEYDAARERVENAVRTARKTGDYPLLSGGDINLYSLFVERAMALAKPDGMVGLVVPSGIASGKTAARFFRGVATEGRLKTLYDFENKKSFFRDVHPSTKFCVFVASPSPIASEAQCAFFLHNVAELEEPDRRFPLTAADFARVNPNTGTASIFRSRRDAELTTAIYARLPVLVDRSTGEQRKAWPVSYTTMFHMTNDSGLFRTRAELEERERAWPVGGNRWHSPAGEWVPLYQGMMVQAFDHRAASVQVNPQNLHRPAQPEAASPAQQRDPDWLPEPQFWVLRSRTDFPEASWLLSFKDVTAPTNSRSMIAAFAPAAGLGNTLPILASEDLAAGSASLLLANLNSIPFDFVARQKIQGQHLNWFILEQLPVAPPDLYETTQFGAKTAAEVVREAVLELTYTAHDMAPFARDMGHVDEAGEALPPFRWDEERRLRLRAKLDAAHFHLYGVTDRDDIRYIYSTFPIVERQERKAWGRYRSRDLCLAWMNALEAGRPDADIEL